LLSIVRWPNVLFTAITQYIIALYIASPVKGTWAVLADLELHLIVFATAFLIAGGFIINSFYDFEKDMVNRPHRTLFSRIVSKDFCLKTYFVVTILGVGLSAFASWRVLLFFSAFAFGLWFYSHKLQRYPIVREATSATLAVVSVFGILLYYQVINSLMVVYAAIFMSLMLNREIIKNLRNYDGDVAVGNQTISTYWGKRVSLRLFTGITALVLVGLMAFFQWSTGRFTLYFSSGISLIALIALALLWMRDAAHRLRIAHNFYKIAIAACILYLVIY